MPRSRDRVSILLVCVALTTGCRKEEMRSEGAASSSAPPVASIAVTAGPSASAPSAVEPPATDAASATALRATEECTAFATAICAREKTCAHLTFLLEYADEAACVLTQQVACMRESRAPASGLSPAACAEAIAKRPCGLWTSLDDMDIPACHPKGALAIGAACTFDTQCASALCGGDNKRGPTTCVYDGDKNPAVMLRSFNEGAPEVRCPHGMMRIRAGCSPIYFPGQVCHVGAAPIDPCLLSSCHIVDAALGKGTCVRDPGCGEKCGTWQTCDEDAGACRDAKLVADGAACDGEHLRCHGGSRCTRGTCARLGREGEACGIGCMPPFACTAGTCAMPRE